MSQIVKRLASVTVALAAVMALPAAAAQPAAESAKTLSSSDGVGMVVVRDADTGKLRMPTAAEHEKLQRGGRDGAARVAAPAAMAPRSHHSGARGTRLTDELMHHSVMVRNADGSTSLMCVDSNGVAHALHDDQAQTKTTAAMPRAAAKLQTE